MIGIFAKAGGVKFGYTALKIRQADVVQAKLRPQEAP